MVGGFNTNVRYRGRTFHVQTEDSGPNVAKIVTLLYEGGTILFSRKTAYGPDASGREAVRGLMEQQHKEMVEALKTGELDSEIGFDAEPPTPSDREPATEREPEPPVVVERRPKRPATPAPRPAVRAVPAGPGRPRDRSEDVPAREFGQGVITQKPLDEVVLAHLAAK